MDRGTIALIEDEKKLLDILLFNLKEEYSISGFSSAEEFLQVFPKVDLAMVITDVRLPGMDGLSLMEEVKKEHPEVPIIIITAYGSIDQAVSAVKRGAYDYLTKPVTVAALKNVIERAFLFISSIAGEGITAFLEEGADFITKDPATIEQCNLAAKVSPIKVPVLILGETGTGKELIAEMIHQKSGRKGEIVKINCAAIPSELLEGELFGYKKGAFTGATESYAGKLKLADKGTIFLDEIGDMPESLQVKLLRVLETESFYPVGDNKLQKVDIRIIAATNKNIKDAVERGDFRSDLFYRLAVVPIRIPPLRERRGDIRLIAWSFLTQLREQGKTEAKNFEESVLSVLERYKWPGNVRELRNVITHMGLLSSRDSISLENLPPGFGRNGEERWRIPRNYEELKGMKKEARVEAASELEIDFIHYILERSDWNVSQAAEAAGIDRRLLQNMIKQYGVKKDRSP